MKSFSRYCLFMFAFFALQLSQHTSAQSVNDIKEYCQSMTSSGMTEEDLQSFMNDCVAEQSSYFQPEADPEQYQEPSYENNDENEYEQNYEQSYEPESYEPDQNCYAKVDEHIQKLLDIDPNTEFDYDQLIDQCLSGKL